MKSAAVMGTPSDHTARASILYTTVWGLKLMTSALSTTLVSSWGTRPGPTRNTWGHTALATMRPSGVSPATVWSFKVVGTWSSATVTAPPAVGTKRGAPVVVVVAVRVAPEHATRITAVVTSTAGTAARRRRVGDLRPSSVAGPAARPLPPGPPAVTAIAGPGSRW